MHLKYLIYKPFDNSLYNLFNHQISLDMVTGGRRGTYSPHDWCHVMLDWVTTIYNLTLLEYMGGKSDSWDVAVQIVNQVCKVTIEVGEEVYNSEDVTLRIIARVQLDLG